MSFFCLLSFFKKQEMHEVFFAYFLFQKKVGKKKVGQKKVG